MMDAVPGPASGGGGAEVGRGGSQVEDDGVGGLVSRTRKENGAMVAVSQEALWGEKVTKEPMSTHPVPLILTSPRGEGGMEGPGDRATAGAPVRRWPGRAAAATEGSSTVT